MGVGPLGARCGAVDLFSEKGGEGHEGECEWVPGVVCGGAGREGGEVDYVGWGEEGGAGGSDEEVDAYGISPHSANLTISV